MKLSLIVISIVIGLQATSLLYSAQERFIYHNSIYEIYKLVTGNTVMRNCFVEDQEFRFIVVAFMYASAYLLFTSEVIWAAFISQLLWLIFESNLLVNCEMLNIQKLFIQLLILYVLAEHLCDGCCNLPNDSEKKSETKQVSTSEKKKSEPQSVPTSTKAKNQTKNEQNKQTKSQKAEKNSKPKKHK